MDSCSICGLYFSKNKFHLKRHEDICSNKSSELSCDKCSYITNKRSNLKRHNCQNKCVQCQENFINNRQLRKHVANVHELVCSVCGKEFTRKDNLKTHIKTLHKLMIGDGVLKTEIGYMKINQVLEKKSIKYTFTNKTNICDICGFRSPRKYNLERHIQACHKSV